MTKQAHLKNKAYAFTASQESNLLSSLLYSFSLKQVFRALTSSKGLLCILGKQRKFAQIWKTKSTEGKKKVKKATINTLRHFCMSQKEDTEASLKSSSHSCNSNPTKQSEQN